MSALRLIVAGCVLCLFIVAQTKPDSASGATSQQTQQGTQSGADTAGSTAAQTATGDSTQNTGATQTSDTATGGADTTAPRDTTATGSDPTTAATTTTDNKPSDSNVAADTTTGAATTTTDNKPATADPATAGSDPNQAVNGGVAADTPKDTATGSDPSTGAAATTTTDVAADTTAPRDTTATGSDPTTAATTTGAATTTTDKPATTDPATAGSDPNAPRDTAAGSDPTTGATTDKPAGSDPNAVHPGQDTTVDPTGNPKPATDSTGAVDTAGNPKPAADATSGNTDNVTPPKDDSPIQGTTPPKDDSTTPPKDDSTTPPRDDSTTPPKDDSTAPKDDSTTPRDDSTTPPKDDSNTPKDDSTVNTPDDSTTPPKDDTPKDVNVAPVSRPAEEVKFVNNLPQIPDRMLTGQLPGQARDVFVAGEAFVAAPLKVEPTKQYTGDMVIPDAIKVNMDAQATTLQNLMTEAAEKAQKGEAIPAARTEEMRAAKLNLAQIAANAVDPNVAVRNPKLAAVPVVVSTVEACTGTPDLKGTTEALKWEMSADRATCDCPRNTIARRLALAGESASKANRGQALCVNGQWSVLTECMNPCENNGGCSTDEKCQIDNSAARRVCIKKVQPDDACANKVGRVCAEKCVVEGSSFKCVSEGDKAANICVDETKTGPKCNDALPPVQQRKYQDYCSAGASADSDGFGGVKCSCANGDEGDRCEHPTTSPCAELVRLQRDDDASQVGFAKGSCTLDTANRALVTCEDGWKKDHYLRCNQPASGVRASIASFTTAAASGAEISADTFAQVQQFVPVKQVKVEAAAAATVAEKAQVDADNMVRDQENACADAIMSFISTDAAGLLTGANDRNEPVGSLASSKDFTNAADREQVCNTLLPKMRAADATTFAVAGCKVSNTVNWITAVETNCRIAASLDAVAPSAQKAAAQSADYLAAVTAKASTLDADAIIRDVAEGKLTEEYMKDVLAADTTKDNSSPMADAFKVAANIAIAAVSEAQLSRSVDAAQLADAKAAAYADMLTKTWSADADSMQRDMSSGANKFVADDLIKTARQCKQSVVACAADSKLTSAEGVAWECNEARVVAAVAEKSTKQERDVAMENQMASLSKLHAEQQKATAAAPSADAVSGKSKAEMQEDQKTCAQRAAAVMTADVSLVNDVNGNYICQKEDVDACKAALPAECCTTMCDRLVNAVADPVIRAEARTSTDAVLTAAALPTARSDVGSVAAKITPGADTTVTNRKPNKEVAAEQAAAATATGKSTNAVATAATKLVGAKASFDFASNRVPASPTAGAKTQAAIDAERAGEMPRLSAVEEFAATVPRDAAADAAMTAAAATAFANGGDLADAVTAAALNPAGVADAVNSAMSDPNVAAALDSLAAAGNGANTLSAADMAALTNGNALSADDLATLTNAANAANAANGISATDLADLTNAANAAGANANLNDLAAQAAAAQQAVGSTADLNDLAAQAAAAQQGVDLNDLAAQAAAAQQAAAGLGGNAKKFSAQSDNLARTDAVARTEEETDKAMRLAVYAETVRATGTTDAAIAKVEAEAVVEVVVDGKPVNVRGDDADRVLQIKAIRDANKAQGRKHTIQDMAKYVEDIRKAEAAVSALPEDSPIKKMDLTQPIVQKTVATFKVDVACDDATSCSAVENNVAEKFSSDFISDVDGRPSYVETSKHSLVVDGVATKTVTDPKDTTTNATPSTPAPADSDPSMETYVIVIIVAAVVLLVGAVAVFMCMKKRNGNQYSQGGKNLAHSEYASNYEAAETGYGSADYDNYGNSAAETGQSWEQDDGYYA